MDLPTWIPDFRHHSFSDPFPVCDSWQWDMGGPLLGFPQIVSPDQLHLQAKILSIVDVTCPVFCSSSIADQKMTFTSILNRRQMISRDVSEESWLRVIAMTLIFGLDLNDRPAGPEYHDYFGQYLECLQASSSQRDISKIRKKLYHRTLREQIDGWKGFTTSAGSFCVEPAEVEVGDLIYAVPCCRLPLVLRPAPETSQSQGLQHAILVGWCASQQMVQKKTWVPIGPCIEVLLS